MAKILAVDLSQQDPRGTIGQDKLGGGKFVNIDLGDYASYPSAPDAHAQQGKLGKSYRGYIPGVHHPEYFPAKNQSAMQVLGNAIGQFGVEATLGMVEGIGYLFDFPGYLAKHREVENDFTNRMSNWAATTKEHINQNVFPIYSTPESEGFSPLNGRWWAKNFSSVASMVSLLGPATAVGKAAGLLGRALKAGVIGEQVIGGIGAAFASRHMESLMEANGLMRDMMNQGATLEEASIAAAQNYKDNQKLLAIDIVQHLSLFGNYGKALQKTFSRSAEAAEKTGKAILMEGLIQAPGEALEEAYQFVSQKEGELIGRGEVEPGAIFGKGFTKRFHEYAMDQEMWTSAFFGAIGGAVMPIAFNGMNNFSNFIPGNKQKQDKIDEISMFDFMGKETDANIRKDQEFFATAIHFAHQGRMKDYEDLMNAFAEENGDNPIIQKNAERIRELLPEFEKMYNQVRNRANYSRHEKFENIENNHSQLFSMEIGTLWEKLRYNEALTGFQSEIDNIYANILDRDLDPALHKLFELYLLDDYYRSLPLDKMSEKEQKAHKREGAKITRQLSEEAKLLQPTFNLSFKEEVDSEGNTVQVPNRDTLRDTIFSKVAEHWVDAKNSVVNRHLVEKQLDKINKDLPLFKTATGQKQLLKRSSDYLGKLYKEAEDMLTPVMAEGTLVTNAEGRQLKIKRKDDKWILVPLDGATIPGETTDPFTDEEYDKFIKKGEISVGRLAQIANKVASGKSLTRKERAVQRAKEQEISELIDNQSVTNKGEGFELLDLAKWLDANDYTLEPNEEYINAMNAKATLEQIEELNLKMANYQNSLDKLEVNKNWIEKEIAKHPENKKLAPKLKNFTDQIAKVTAAMRNTQIEIAVLENPELRKAEILKIDKALFEKYDNIRKRLEKEKKSIEDSLDALHKNLTAGEALLKQIRNDIRAGRVKAKEVFTTIKELEAEVKTIEEDISFNEEVLDIVEKDLEENNKRLENIVGEELLLMKAKLMEDLNGTDEKPGLRKLLSDAQKEIERAKKKYEAILSDLRYLFDIPLSKLDDDAYIDARLDEIEKMGDAEINELIENARTRHQIGTRLNELADDIAVLKAAIDQVIKDIKAIQDVEDLAYGVPKEIKTDLKGDDTVRPITEGDTLTVFTREPEDYFDRLAGMQYDMHEKINDSPEQRRFFRFVSDTWFGKSGYFIKVVSPIMEVGGKEQDTIYAGVDPSYKFKKGDLVAIIVDSDGDAVDIDGLKIDPADLKTRGVFSYIRKPEVNNNYINTYRKSRKIEKGSEQDKDFLKRYDKVIAQYKTQHDSMVDFLMESTGNWIGMNIIGKAPGIKKTHNKKIPAALIVQNAYDVVLAKSSEVTADGFKITSQPGTIYVRDMKSGNVHQVYNRKLNEDEVAVVYAALQEALKEDVGPGKKNPFDHKIKGLGVTVKDLMGRFIYNAPETSKNKGGYFFEEKDKAGNYTGKIIFEEDRIRKSMSFVEWMSSENVVKSWLRKQHHQVSYNLLKKQKLKNYIRYGHNKDGFHIVQKYEGENAYKDYLMDKNFGVLETDVPPYQEFREEDTPSQYEEKVQRKSQNLLIDSSNIGRNKLPTNKKEANKKEKKATTKKTTTRKKEKKPDPSRPDNLSSGFDPIAAGRAALALGKDDDSINDQRKKGKGLESLTGALENTDDFSTDEKYEGNKREATQESYNIENLVKAQAWFKERYPHIPFRVVSRLIETHGAFGMFTKHGEVLLDPFAEEGTIYHEAFHVTTGLYLGASGRKALYNQWRKANNKNLTDAEVEEILAEDFRNYMMTGVMPDYKVPRNFFQKLLDFIKWTLGLNQSSIEEVFENIKNGAYKNNIPVDTALTRDWHRSQAGRAFNGKTVKFTKDIVQGIDYIFFSKYGKGEAVGERIKLVNDLLSGTVAPSALGEIYSSVREHIEKDITQKWNPLVNKALSIIETSDDPVRVATAEKAFERFDAQLDARLWILNNFDEVTAHHTKVLEQRGIMLKDDSIPEDDLPGDELEVSDEGMDNDWDGVEMERNGKLTVSNVVKLYLSIIPKTYTKVVKGKTETFVASNDLGFSRHEDFGFVYAILSNQLAGSTSIDEMLDRLVTLKRDIPSIKEVISLFNLNIPDIQLTPGEQERKTKFFNAFSKEKNNYTKDIISTGNRRHVKTNTPIKQSQIVSEWASTFKPEVTLDAAATIRGDGDLSFNQAVSQMKRMGLDFENYDRLNLPQQIEFADSIQLITREILAKKPVFEDKQVTFKEGGKTKTKTVESKVKGTIRKLAGLKYQTGPDDISNSHIALGNKTNYDIFQFSYLSRTVRELNNIARNYDNDTDRYIALDDLLPHLTDTYSADSKILSRVLNSGEEIEHSFMEGLDVPFERGKPYSKLTFFDRYFTEMNNVLNGRYHMIRPSENQQERLFHFGLFVSPEEIDLEESGLPVPVKSLLYYLSSELRVIKEANSPNSEWANWKSVNKALSLNQYPESLKNAVEKGEITADSVILLRSGILSSLIKSEDALDTIRKYVLNQISIDDVLAHPGIQGSIVTWYDSVVDNVLNTIAPFFDSLHNMVIHNTDKELYSDMAKKEPEKLAALFAINYIIGNIEQTKLFMGHPAFYEDPDNALKRMSGLVGTKSSLRVDDLMNEYLESIGLGKENPGKMRTAVVADIVSKSKYVDTYYNILGPRLGIDVAKTKKGMYEKIKESDAQGLMTLDEYKEYLIREGNWGWKQEMVYQWEKQEGWNDKKVVIPADSYEEIAGKTITKENIEIEGAYLVPLKPQYFGPLAENKFVPSYYKLSVMPMLPSLVGGTNMGKISKAMEEKGIGLLVFESANKVGTKVDSNHGFNVQPIYDKEGNINTELTTQDTHYKYWGTQVYNAPKSKFRASSGTQFLKLIESDIMPGGIPFDYLPDEKEQRKDWHTLTEPEKASKSDLYAKILELRRINSARQSVGRYKLAQRFGMTKRNIDGEDYYTWDESKDAEIIEFLSRELGKRDVAQNVIDSISHIRNGVDVLVNGRKIENILMSIADRMTVKQKRLGKSSVQVSSALLEKEGIRKFEIGKDGNVVYGSSDLEFYRLSEDGKRILEMEVMLPHYFKELLGQDVKIDELEDRLRSLIGFRIPTQALSSIDNIRIKGFLPPQLGDMVVVPSELVVKTGSDFDFDKLFLHFPHYEYTQDGPKYLEYTNSENDIWNKRKHSFALSLPYSIEKIDAIEREYRDGVSRLISDKVLTTEAWRNTVLPAAQKLGIETKGIKDMLYWVGKHISIREELFENDLIADEDSIRVNEELTQLDNILEDLERLDAKLKLASDAIGELSKVRQEKLDKVYADIKPEFDKFSLEEKNGTEAIENRMMELHKELLSHPNRMAALINPLDASVFKSKADVIKKIKLQSNPDAVRRANEKPLALLADPNYIISKGISFLEAKGNVGIGALNVTSHILFSQNDVRINLGRKENIYLDHNKVDGKPSLAGEKDYTGNYYISDLLSELINAFVDAAKDPFIFDINAGRQGVGVFSLMLKMGVPIDTLVMFMNQPIVTEYLKFKEMRGVTTIRRGAGIYDINPQKLARELFHTERKLPKQTLRRTFNDYDVMRSQLEKYASGKELSDLNKQIQQAVLDQYLTLERIADDLRVAVGGLFYDTKGVGKDTMATATMLKVTEKVIESNRFENYDKMFKEGSFMGPFRDSVAETLKIYEPMMNHLTNPEMKRVFDKMTDILVPEFNKDIIGDVFKSDMITFMVQTGLSMWSQNEHMILSYSGGTPNNTVPRQIQALKRKFKREGVENKLINDLEVILDVPDPNNPSRRIDNLALRPNSKIDSIDSDIYSEYWEALDPIMAKNLVKFLWMQSGLQNSPINFIDIVPADIYNELMEEALADINNDFTPFISEFFFNNTNAPFWKEVYSLKKLKTLSKEWPAVKLIRTYGFDRTESFYYEGKLINKLEMKGIRNFKNKSTAKYYPGKTWREYIYDRDSNKLKYTNKKVAGVPMPEKGVLTKDPNIKLEKIISGGQTGVDRIGLKVGWAFGIPTGGKAPKGFKTEGKQNDSLLLQAYGLEETESSDYAYRTEQNVINSDGTVVFGDTYSPGTKVTLNFVKKHNKPVAINPSSEQLRTFIQTKNIKVLNVAGNRMSKLTMEQMKEFYDTMVMAIVKKEC